MEINVAENLSVSEVKEVSFFEAPKPKEKKLTERDIADAFSRMKKLRESLGMVQNIVLQTVIHVDLHQKCFIMIQPESWQVLQKTKMTL